MQSFVLDNLYNTFHKLQVGHFIFPSKDNSVWKFSHIFIFGCLSVCLYPINVKTDLLKILLGETKLYHVQIYNSKLRWLIEQSYFKFRWWWPNLWRVQKVDGDGPNLWRVQKVDGDGPNLCRVQKVDGDGPNLWRVQKVDGDGPNLCRVQKVDVSSTFIENIFRPGLTLVSSWVVSDTKIKNKLDSRQTWAPKHYCINLKHGEEYCRIL